MHWLVISQQYFHNNHGECVTLNSRIIGAVVGDSPREAWHAAWEMFPWRQNETCVVKQAVNWNDEAWAKIALHNRTSETIKFRRWMESPHATPGE